MSFYFTNVFDHEDHILLQKLQFYGKGSALMKSYISNCKKCVQLNCQKSSITPVGCRIPQYCPLTVGYLNDLKNFQLSEKRMIFA